MEEGSVTWLVNIKIVFNWICPELNDSILIFTDGRAFRNMLDELCSLIKQEKLTAPVCNKLHFEEYQKALEAAMQPYTSAKQVLIM